MEENTLKQEKNKNSTPSEFGKWGGGRWQNHPIQSNDTLTLASPKTRTYGGQSPLRDPRRPGCLSRRLRGEEVRSLTYPASFFASMTASQKEETSSQSRSLLQRHSGRRESRDDLQPPFTITCFFRTFSIVTLGIVHRSNLQV
ncbi:hypothetical protein SFRURICE_019654 [Spodoptera frugiperda]|nr:hypothetical protein SFRURICE_019654 [Spodoptera frugiperda]